MDTLFSDELLTHSFFIFLLLGSVVGMIAGATLLIRPGWLLQAGKVVNRWVSTRKLMRIFARSVALEGWLYRYNVVFGVLLSVCSLYIIYFFTVVFDKKLEQNNFFKFDSIPPILMDGLLDAATLFFLIAAVFIFLISLFLIFRPSMLKDLEDRANHKTSIRKGLKPLEKLHDSLDQYVLKHKRVVGLLLFTGSVYTLATLALHWKVI